MTAAAPDGDDHVSAWAAQLSEERQPDDGRGDARAGPSGGSAMHADSDDDEDDADSPDEDDVGGKGPGGQGPAEELGDEEWGKGHVEEVDDEQTLVEEEALAHTEGTVR